MQRALYLMQLANILKETQMAKRQNQLTTIYQGTPSTAVKYAVLHPPAVREVQFCHPTDFGG